MKVKQKLTSVNLPQPLYTEFQVKCLEDNFSFKKLADRAIFLYLNDKEFREKIHNQKSITLE